MSPAIQPVSLPRQRESHASTAPMAPSASKRIDGWGLLEWFILAQVILPAVLYLPGTQGLRIWIRVAPFALSIGGLVLWLYRSKSSRAHPAATLLLLIIAYLTLMIAHPQTNTWLAGIAQVGMSLAIMAPVFWVPQLVKSRAQVQRVLAILLVCNGINSAVGVLQVYDPDRWLPKEFSTISENTAAGIIRFIGPDGREIVRPPGLSDDPGAVCGPASTAALLGLVFFVQPIGALRRGSSLAACFTGLAAIYLSHVRTSILIVGGMFAVYVIMLLLRKEGGRAMVFGAFAALLLFLSLLFATLLGGESVFERFASLFEADPTTVYYSSSRGYMLQYDTQRYLSEYPLGAGLGRWGMMRIYFGDDDNPSSPPLWAEVQWPAWALDGGFVLLILYAVALIVTSWEELLVCLRLPDSLAANQAITMFASNAGAIALTFGFCTFNSPAGLQYWFLAGVIFGSWQLYKARRKPA